MACRLGPFCEQFGIGESLFATRRSPITPARFQTELQKALKAQGVQHADLFTLKSFRASKATELAKKGVGLGIILADGEWRSRAFLAYTNEQKLDEMHFLATTIDASDDENIPADFGDI